MSEPPLANQQSIVTIGLGSNLGTPGHQIAEALRALAALSATAIRVSPIYQSKAVGPKQPDYLNAVAQITTALAPLALLDALQGIETQQKRVKTVRWGPRTIDLDILTFADSVINQPRLNVPHPLLTERNFVIVPLHDIAPNLILPSGVTLASLRELCDTDDLIKYTALP